jgi:hypothetical protein
VVEVSAQDWDADRERKAIVSYLRECRDFWQNESRRLYRNPHAAAHCTAKSIILDGVAKDIEELVHRGAGNT